MHRASLRAPHLAACSRARPRHERRDVQGIVNKHQAKRKGRLVQLNAPLLSTLAFDYETRLQHLPKRHRKANFDASQRRIMYAKEAYSTRKRDQQHLPQRHRAAAPQTRKAFRDTRSSLATHMHWRHAVTAPQKESGASLLAFPPFRTSSSRASRAVSLAAYR